MVKKKISKTVLVIPFPAQGHVNPFMNLSFKLAQNGFNVIFVNLEFIHNRMLTCSTLAHQDGVVSVNGSRIRFVSIPDGLGPEDNQNDFVSLGSMLRTMPVILEKFIGDLSSKVDDITCVVADGMMGWAVEVASKLGIKTAVLWIAAAATFAVQYHIPKLIHEEIIDCAGVALEKKTFKLSSNMPTMVTQDIFWNKLIYSEAQKSMFDYITKTTPFLNSADWWFCNTTYELEPETLSFMPKIQPIGPLLESHHDKERPLGNLWKKDMSCLDWLDQHPPCSVIYIAFGSFVAFDSKQFQEIALGLELTNRPFLWVVREDSIYRLEKEAYPHELKGNKGKIVRWAPQWDVLSHPSIACFISHCGWNSIVDGLCNGVPFLCWPHFGDQFLNKTYMCGEWKVGLGIECDDENGFVSSAEIKKKVEDLLGDGDIRARSLKMKEVVMNNLAHGGRSSGIFNKFVEWLKM